MNNTYKSMIDQYAIKKNSHRVHLKIDARRMPGEDVLDRAAEQKLTAGYTSKNVRCTKCFEKKSLSGDCFCTI